MIDKSTYGEIMRVNGERKAKIKIAEKMIKRGTPIETIAEDTGLSEKEIEKIVAEFKNHEQQ